MEAKDSILVIDDNQDFLELVSTLLEDEGYEVETAKSGEEGIEKTVEKLYSLALIDIVLPDFEGTHLLKKLFETDPKMRKIIITGYPTLENTQEALNMGADAYLVKPVKIDKLLETVKNQLAQQKKEFQEKYLMLEG
jgi:DNA-binding NtrC family response regulator